MFCGHRGTSSTWVQSMWSNRADAAEAQYSLYCRQAGALPTYIAASTIWTGFTEHYTTLENNRQDFVIKQITQYCTLPFLYRRSYYLEWFYTTLCVQTDPLILIMLQVPFFAPILVLLLRKVAIDTEHQRTPCNKAEQRIRIIVQVSFLPTILVLHLCTSEWHYRTLDNTL